MGRLPEKGTIVVVARIIPKEGKAARVEELLLKVRASAESDKEPRCKSYRTVKSLDQPTTFSVFEEYDGAQGVKEHGRTEAFQTLGKVAKDEDLLVEAPIIHFFTEIGKLHQMEGQKMVSFD
ncbi:uncharacterized protein L969DRAFT_71929 [Mixia osmundae IAM 14324]|uniref:ABM domain-containing protein n=1 Tax=Mixia osmundae (strain CBS 9802 / IAM 14324 / JCM 22182 / KY 12970) TaxID=764103 RepID=G7E5W7_MIXOS|nr:uncharacterized protein L969DRAFT_71929 [Mixia osmundae IAM 14324]KEI40621.1 hypothetical protein L969DRAFT_71929 [Mixia osmundae IAM 14324]GAA98227.1 hypothetical protein E5Q_04910 [Mixia osmundae IAM 14324]